MVLEVASITHESCSDEVMYRKPTSFDIGFRVHRVLRFCLSF